MKIKYFVNLYVFIYLFYQFEECSTARMTYMITERPVVTYVNNSYVKSIVVTSRRHRANRRDPRYYTDIIIQTLIPLGNNAKMDIYFYEFLTNRYRPSFVEFHFGFCDMIEKDIIFGKQIKEYEALLNVSCPYPPGQYNLTDMSITYVPQHFPFRKGRIYFNVTLVKNHVITQIGRAYIDMELKEMSFK